MDEDTTATILTLETLAANAWPAHQHEWLDGWQLRFSEGVTRRANSVWPNATMNAEGLDEKLAHVEAFYAHHHLPARYQISPAAQPIDLDTVLAERGYHSVARTAVQTVALPTILTRTPGLRTQPDFAVELAEEFDEVWFAAFCEFENIAGHHAIVLRAILESIRPLNGYALLRIDGAPAALALGVVEGDWLGIFCMATDPAFRRRGAASAILRTLAIWAQLYDARWAYLQVMDENVPARALYARVGFETLYHYHYREKV
jgi:N-acetylglutamate synthase